MAYRRQKISQMPPKGANLQATDLLEISEVSGTGYITKSITGQEIIDAAGGGGGSQDLQQVTDIGATTTNAIQITHNGSTDTLTANHTSGSGIGLLITKGGNNEGLKVNKTSGSGNAATIIGTLEATTLVKTGGTSAEFLMADGSTSLGGGITVGTTAVTSGTIGRVFFQAGGVVQQDGNFTYDNTLKRLGLKAVGTASTDIPFNVQNSAGTQNIISAQGDGKTTFSNSMLEIENNDVTGIGYTRLRKITVGTFNKGSELSLFKNDNTSNIEIVRFQALSEGGVFVFPESAGTKSIQIGSSLTVGNNGGVAMYSSGTQTHNIQIRNQFHNVFHVTGIGAQATLRIGNAGTNVNFFNVHGNNAGNLTTNPIFTINSSGTVGIGTEASTPAARLDVRAQGALSTDIAFRVRNSADSANTLSVQGDGQVVFLTNTSNTITIGGTGSRPTIFGTSLQIGVSTSGNRLSFGSSEGFTGSYNHSGGTHTFRNNFNDDRGTTLILGDQNSALYFHAKNGQNLYLSTSPNTAAKTWQKSFWIQNGVAPNESLVDHFSMYSTDITAGNAAPHFRTENGAIVKVYQETTGVGASTLVTGVGTPLTDTDTFDGYTLKQIVKALRNQGLLA
jgi:hypothetical protein